MVEPKLAEGKDDTVPHGRSERIRATHLQRDLVEVKDERRAEEGDEGIATRRATRRTPSTARHLTILYLDNIYKLHYKTEFLSTQATLRGDCLTNQHECYSFPFMRYHHYS